jgi:2-haloacid dehalogenase
MAGECWVSFDCFGTLIDWHSGFRAILTPIAGAQTSALITAYHAIERAMEAQTPHRLYRDILTAGLVQAAEDLGMTLPSAEKDILVRRWGDQPLFPDVAEALAQLRSAGWKLAVLTNCDDSLFAQTLAANPALAPDLVITAEQVSSYKPAFGHFEHFEHQTGVARRNWIHVANSWFHDMEPARRYGITRVWVNRDCSADDPAIASHTMPGVAGLAGVLAGLTG